MQKIKFISVGSLSGFYAAAMADYQKRLAQFCQFETIDIPAAPLDEKKATPALVAAALEKEGEKIMAAVPASSALVALCVEGKPLTSEAFSAYIANAALSGKSGVAFAVGSSHGLSNAVKNKADFKLSLSAMTLPHALARVVLAEQVYRAFSIQNNTPYHK